MTLRFVLFDKPWPDFTLPWFLILLNLIIRDCGRIKISLPTRRFVIGSSMRMYSISEKEEVPIGIISTQSSFLFSFFCLFPTQGFGAAPMKMEFYGSGCNFAGVVL